MIECIFYDGTGPSEPDEYVRIRNTGTAAVDLRGWVLVDVADGYPAFEFPSHTLAPGQEVRVYTNEVHPEWGGFSFGYGRAIWHNTEPDAAALLDSHGNEVSRVTYPPGC
ncbi:MAG: lamin tail domain-containing protein [Gemmatimonadetes bacterium]|nr:lamin tail domain-containing protein [Gemmatimonadota bacterium]